VPEKKCKFPGNVPLISRELSWSFLNMLSTIVKFCMSCTFKVVFKDKLSTFETWQFSCHKTLIHPSFFISSADVWNAS